MQPKACAVLIAVMILLMVVIPASAYDYRGVPRPGDNNDDTSSSYVDDESTSLDVLSDPGQEDFSSLLGSTDLTTLISIILYFIFQLLGIPLS